MRRPCSCACGTLSPQPGQSWKNRAGSARPTLLPLRGSERSLTHTGRSAANQRLKGSPEGLVEPQNPRVGGTLHFLCSNPLQRGDCEHWSSVVASSGPFQVTACVGRETHAQAGAGRPPTVRRALPHLGPHSASLTRPFRGPREAALSCGHPPEPLQGCQENTPSPPFTHTDSGRAWASGVFEAPQVARMGSRDEGEPLSSCTRRCRAKASRKWGPPPEGQPGHTGQRGPALSPQTGGPRSHPALPEQQLVGIPQAQAQVQPLQEIQECIHCSQHGGPVRQ